MKDGEVLTMDYRAAAEHLHESQQRIADEVPNRDWAHRSADQISPPSFLWK